MKAKSFLKCNHLRHEENRELEQVQSFTSWINCNCALHNAVKGACQTQKLDCLVGGWHKTKEKLTVENCLGDSNIEW